LIGALAQKLQLMWQSWSGFQGAIAAGQPLPVIGAIQQQLVAAQAQAQSLGGLNATVKSGDSIDAESCQLNTQILGIFWSIHFAS